MKGKYLVNELASITGMTRDTLRYYEQQGLIQPKKNQYNNYREFEFNDIYRLMAIDFYRKRDFSIKEIRDLQDNSQFSFMKQTIRKKRIEVETAILQHKIKLEKLKKLADFCENVEECLNQISIKRMPLFEVVDHFSDFSSCKEYNKIVNQCEEETDMLSMVIRSYNFDSQGIKSSRFLIVKEILDDRITEEAVYLNFPKCLYTVVIDDPKEQNSESIPLKMFDKVSRWARHKEIQLLGEAYVHTIMVAFEENREQAILEIFVPFK